MAAASAPSRRQARTGGFPTWAFVLVLVTLALAGYLFVRSRNAAAATLDTSGTPGPDLSGSAAQQPQGGAASVPGNLPLGLLSQPDQVQQKVQQTDAGGTATAESPTASSVSYSYTNPLPGQTAPASFQIGSTYYTESSPGSDYLIAAPPAHPGVAGGASQLPPSMTGVHRPGLQD